MDEKKREITLESILGRMFESRLRCGTLKDARKEQELLKQRPELQKQQEKKSDIEKDLLDLAKSLKQQLKEGTVYISATPRMEEMRRERKLQEQQEDSQKAI